MNSSLSTKKNINSLCHIYTVLRSYNNYDQNQMGNCEAYPVHMYLIYHRGYRPGSNTRDIAYFDFDTGALYFILTLGPCISAWPRTLAKVNQALSLSYLHIEVILHDSRCCACPTFSFAHLYINTQCKVHYLIGTDHSLTL